MPRPERRRLLRASATLALSGWLVQGSAQGIAEGPAALAWFARASELPGFTIGAAGAPPAVLIFFDPHCMHCQRLWRDLREHPVAAAVRWVPVVLLGPASARSGAALLRAADPSRLMDRLAQGGDPHAEQATEIEPSLADTRALRQNTASLRALDVTAVPAIVHRGVGTQIGLTIGAMPATHLARLLGRPAQPQGKPPR